MINSLPDLCVWVVVGHLTKNRRQCDMVRDCITLAITARETRRLFSLAMVRILNPASDLERIQATTNSASLLRQACRSNHLAVGGNKATLLERLNHALWDPRLPGCGLGKIFCARQARAARREMCAVRRRKSCLMKALTARGNCMRAVGCGVCRAYVEGVGGRSLTATVDHAEEVQFFETQTDFNRIVTTIRQFDADSNVGFGDESRICMSRREALRRWALQQQRARNTGHSLRYLMAKLPRSLHHNLLGS